MSAGSEELVSRWTGIYRVPTAQRSHSRRVRDLPSQGLRSDQMGAREGQHPPQAVCTGAEQVAQSSGARWRGQPLRHVDGAGGERDTTTPLLDRCET